MRKIINKRIVVCFLAILLIANILYLEFPSKKTSYAASTSDYEIWTAPNTVKILRQQEYAVKDVAIISMAAAANEYESAQLIVTPKINVASYSLTVSNLISPSGAIIYSDAFTVFMQKYVNITINSNYENYPKGYYPDALVPLDLAIGKSENKISAGNNQGLYITVKIPKNTPKGIYTGNFNLNVDGLNIPIPARLEVWDFELSDEVNTQSAYYIQRDWLMNGELDNSEDMYQNYYDFLLDYRISATDLPVSAGGATEFVDTAKIYSTDARCSSYRIPFTVVFCYNSLAGRIIADVDYAKLKEYILLMATESTNEVNLFKKAYFYFNSIIDEPNITGASFEVRHIYQQINIMLLESVAQLKISNPTLFTNIPTLECDILVLQNLVTTGINPEYEGFVKTYVPLINTFDTQAERSRYAQLQNQGDKVWWYNCWLPRNPYPSYHIDDVLISSRVQNWMQKNYNINGFLYWGVANYQKVEADSSIVPRNPYDDPVSFTNAVNGDGFLVYPGLDYGINSPVPSLRLEMARAGLEDYEYLTMLEKLFDKKSYLIGNNTFDSVINQIYCTLYSGTQAYTNINNFSKARTEIARLIVLLKNNGTLANGYDYLNSILNGSLITSDSKYQFTQNNEIAINKTSRKPLRNGTSQLIAGFNDIDELRMFRYQNYFGKLSLNSDFAYIKEGTKSVKIEVSGNPDLGKNYYPTMKICTDSIYIDNRDYSNVESYSLELYNPTNEPIKFYFGIESDSQTRLGGSKILKEIVLTPNAWNHVVININREELSEAIDIKNISNFVFVFDNLAINQTVKPFYLDNFIANTTNVPLSKYSKNQTNEMILDFETDAEISLFKTSGENFLQGQPILSLNSFPSYLYSGVASMKIVSKSIHKGGNGINGYPSVSLNADALSGSSDFSKFEKIGFKAFNNSGKDITINISITDIHGNSKSYYNIVLTNGQWNDIICDISNLPANFDNGNIACFNIFWTGFDDGANYEFYLDQLKFYDSIGDLGTGEAAKYSETLAASSVTNFKGISNREILSEDETLSLSGTSLKLLSDGWSGVRGIKLQNISRVDISNYNSLSFSVYNATKTFNSGLPVESLPLFVNGKNLIGYLEYGKWTEIVLTLDDFARYNINPNNILNLEIFTTEISGNITELYFDRFVISEIHKNSSCIDMLIESDVTHFKNASTYQSISNDTVLSLSSNSVRMVSAGWGQSVGIVLSDYKDRTVLQYKYLNFWVYNSSYNYSTNVPIDTVDIYIKNIKIGASKYGKWTKLSISMAQLKELGVDLSYLEELCIYTNETGGDITILNFDKFELAF